MTESKCHPEKRLCLIAPSLISGWSSQERLIWHLGGNALLHSNGSPSLTWSTSCFPRLEPDDADNWQDNWQVPLGLYDNNPLCSRRGASLRRPASGYSEVFLTLYIFKWLLLEESQPNVIDTRFWIAGLFFMPVLKWKRAVLFFPTLKCYFALPTVFCMMQRWNDITRRGQFKQQWRLWHCKEAAVVIVQSPAVALMKWGERGVAVLIILTNFV